MKNDVLKNRTGQKEVRPVRVAPSRADRVLDLAALALLVFVWVATFRFFTDASGQVPLGVDIMGKPRGWGSPAFYFFIAGLATLVMGGSYWATLRPGLISLPVTLCEKTVAAQSALMVRCVRWLNLISGVLMLVILFGIASFQYEEPILTSREMTVCVMLISIILMPAVIIYYTVKISLLKG